MYDPAVGRFLQEDPIDFAAGDPNLYRYVGNSPTNATDPSGLEFKSVRTHKEKWERVFRALRLEVTASESGEIVTYEYKGDRARIYELVDWVVQREAAIRTSKEWKRLEAESQRIGGEFKIALELASKLDGNRDRGIEDAAWRAAGAQLKQQGYDLAEFEKKFYEGKRAWTVPLDDITKGMSELTKDLTADLGDITFDEVRGVERALRGLADPKIKIFDNGRIVSDPYLQKEYWQAEAQRKINPTGKATFYELNKARTRAYGELFLEDPKKYMWFGLAAIVSKLARNQVMLLEGRISKEEAMQIEQGMFQGDSVIDLVREASRAVLKKNIASLGLREQDRKTLIEMFHKGNREIFDAIYWQVLAMKSSDGYPTGLNRLSKIEGSTPAFIDPMRRLEQGRVTPGKTALDIADWEQRTVFAGVFQRHPEYGEILGRIRRMFDSDRLPRYPIGVINPLPKYKINGRTHEPLGFFTWAKREGIGDTADFTKTKDRWPWVEEMIQHWERLVEKDPALAKALVKRAMGDSP